MGTSLKSVYEKIEILANTSSTNEKIELLKKFLQDKLFNRVVWCTYTQTLTYNVKKLPPYSPAGFFDKGFEYVLPILKKLNSQNGADNNIKLDLARAASIDPETYEIVLRICDGDLKCGIGARLINKAVPYTVKFFPYQRSATSKHRHNIVYEPYAIAQCKADGAFAYLIIERYGLSKPLKFVTRRGNEILQLDHLKNKILEQPPIKQYGPRRGLRHHRVTNFRKTVVMGELRVYNTDGTIMPRKQGNGVISQCLEGLADPKVAKRIFYSVWDIVPMDSFFNGEHDEVYNSRFWKVRCFVEAVNDRKFIKTIPTKLVHSEEEDLAFYREMRSIGEEGSITKNITGLWEDDQSGSKDSIKTKHSFECELRVVGWNYGTKGKKYEHVVGSVICQSSCGKLEVNISGLLDNEREWDWDMMIDSIITAEAESVIVSKTKDKSSLYSPSFIEVRHDKTVANSLEEILEIAEQSSKTRRRKA